MRVCAQFVACRHTEVYRQLCQCASIAHVTAADFAYLGITRADLGLLPCCNPTCEVKHVGKCPCALLSEADDTREAGSPSGGTSGGSTLGDGTRAEAVGKADGKAAGEASGSSGDSRGLLAAAQRERSMPPIDDPGAHDGGDDGPSRSDHRSEGRDGGDGSRSSEEKAHAATAPVGTPAAFLTHAAAVCMSGQVRTLSEAAR